MGYQVTYIAVNQNVQQEAAVFDSIPVYPIASTRYGKLSDKGQQDKLSNREKLHLRILKNLRNIRNLIHITRYPDVDRNQSRKTYKLAKELHENVRFDAIIGVFRPFSCISAAIRLKKEFPELVCGGYYLDLLSGTKKPRFLPTTIYDLLRISGEVRVFQSLDFVILPETGKEDYSNEKFSVIGKKMVFCGLPSFNLSNKKDMSNEKKNAEEIRFVYAGMLYRESRNPDFMLRIFKELSKRLPNISLHIYGRGDCQDVIEKYVESVKIYKHGMVNHNVVLEALSSADFVLNISNATGKMMPSKILELFSIGKPIINFSNNQNDSSRSLFQLYPSVAEVVEWGDFSSELQDVERFILNEKGKSYDPRDFYNDFEEYTPQHIAKIIHERIITSHK